MIDGMNGLMGLEKQMGECLNNGEGEKGNAGIMQEVR